jgi:hypothetical protein
MKIYVKSMNIQLIIPVEVPITIRPHIPMSPSSIPSLRAKRYSCRSTRYSSTFQMFAMIPNNIPRLPDAECSNTSPGMGIDTNLSEAPGSIPSLEATSYHYSFQHLLIDAQESLGAPGHCPQLIMFGVDARPIMPLVLNMNSAYMPGYD